MRRTADSPPSSDPFSLERRLRKLPRPETRYAPVGSRSPDAALAELSERELVELFRQSQPAWTAPEGAYGAR